MKKLSAETLNELLGLPGLVVTEYALEEQEDTEVVHVLCEHRHELAICPGCGEVSSTLHDKSMRSVRHLDIWGKMTLLHFPARRFYCQGCDKPFTETLSWLEEGRRHTQRFELHIFEQCQRSSAEAVARAEQLHPATVRAIFQRWAKRQEKEHRRPLLRRLGVDEIALKKGHKNYALVLSDLARHCVVAVLPNRRQESLSEWLLGLSEDERAAIEVVAMDMWAPYRSVVKRLLPEAEIVADRFHVMKQLNEQLSKLRREVQKGADAKTRKRLKEVRWLLLRRRSELTPDQKEQLQAALEASPELERAYLLKEEFYTICEKMTERSQAQRFLAAWVWRAEASGLAQLSAFVSTLRNWWSEFLNYFNERVNSGVVEGLNNGIRYIIRRACGYHLFEHFRLQVLVEYGGMQRPAPL
jgi:transposase